MHSVKSTRSEIKAFRKKVIEKLLSERNSSGSWEGELSSSALSTAISTFALYQFSKDEYLADINSGLNWLVKNINEDGGYGDTVDSPSNISTTLLCWSAFSLSEKLGRDDSQTIKKIEGCLLKEAGSIEPDKICQRILDVYGDDHTFSVPILTTLAIAGRLGENPWSKVLQLPFELSVFPTTMFKVLKLEVVSYALPALITIGLVRHTKKRSSINPLSWFRSLVTKKALNKLASIQPVNGGFLEATPLTGFVLMSLCESGLKDIEVAQKCASFLKSSIRQDGSYPIDTHLHTWVTTLSINALTETDKEYLNGSDREGLKRFLTDQQYKEVHPYTNAAPGGWAWSPLPGAVPDADDTSGALVALRRLSIEGSMPVKEAEAGIRWLLGLQNSDGGIPTFCRGWGQLPFDQSCPDITAHCLRAFCEWQNDVSPKLLTQIKTSQRALVKYLKNTQRSDGSWNPLWFGNQHNKEKLNLTYGTAQVVIALCELPNAESLDIKDLYDRGNSWLKTSQNDDGSWSGIKGTAGSLEETSLALNALVSSGHNEEQIEKAFQWLIRETKEGTEFKARPIGLYFASLWYDEKMYPLVYTAAAVEKYFSGKA